MSYTPQVHKFFEGQAKDRLFQNLKNAEQLLTQFLAFINRGKIPDGFDVPEELSNPIKGHAAFFSEAAQPIFFSLMSELSSTGIRFRDVTVWRRKSGTQSVPSVSSQQQPETSGPVPPSFPPQEQKQGKLASLGSAVRGLASGTAGFLSPAPLEEAERRIMEEPFEAVPILYRKACIFVEIWGEQMARFHLAQIRLEISIHLTGLLRDVRTYTNELLMETGDQIARIAG